MDTLSDIRHAALALLARREHAARELSDKLSRRFPKECCDLVVGQMAREGLQSDLRFGAAFVRQRSLQGKGPVLIRQELRQRGLDRELLERCLAEVELDWFEVAAAVLARKFPEGAGDPRERQRCQRFLVYRGFRQDHIEHAIRSLDGSASF